MPRARLSISLLGRFQVSLDGQPVGTFESDRVRALLAYLVVESGVAHERSALAALLWPDQPESAARANLRHVLLNLRHAIHDAATVPPFLLTSRQIIQWNASSDTWLDTAAFAALIRACEAHAHAQLDSCPPCIARLKEAIALYRGRFLAGVSLPASTAMEEWAHIMQERLQRHMLEALVHVTSYHEICGDYAEAARYARQQVEIEPWREEGHRQLMRVLGLAGQRSAALNQYQVLCRILADELSARPSSETLALVERIRLDQLQPAVSQSVPPISRSIHNLPAEFNAFIGRAAERRAIHARLDQPYCRLVTLAGPGGAGKTRLAIAAARERLARYADGVWLVPLAGVGEQPAESVANIIASGIADSIGFSLSSAAEPRAQLCDYLRDKHLLLVLDDFEHLMTGVDLLSDIITRAPQVQLLVTTRQVLNLHSEWLLEIAGLPYLESDSAQVEVQPAVALFEERCRQLGPRPVDAPEERAAVQRVCRLVQGMPLAIELAASLTRTMSCSAIAAAITHNLGALATTLRGIPERQRSLRAVFDASWQQLTGDEQVLLAQLSVFRGSFTIEAVTHVVRATSAALSTLQDKSFLHQPQLGRYTLHEVLRFFAAEKLTELAATSNALALTAERHSDYYLSRISRYASTLGGAQTQQAVQDILADLDDVRQAWQWAIDQPDLAAMRRSQSTLILFYRLAGLLHEGAAVLAQAIERLQGLMNRVPDPSPEIRFVLNRLYIEQCHIFRRLSQYAAALASAHEAIRLAQAVNDAAGEAGARYVAGLVLWYQADFAAAQQQAEEALRHYRQLRDPVGESRVHNLLGLIMDQTGHYAAAEVYFKQALALARAAADWLGESMELSNLGRLYGELGDYNRERECYLEALPIVQQSSEPRLYAKTLNDLGFNSYMLGKHAHARACYEQSLAILRSAGDRAWESIALVRMGLLLQRLGELGLARDFGRQALTIARSIGQRDYEGAALAQLGQLCAAEQKWDEAEVHYRQALALRETSGQLPGLPELQAGLAWIAVQQCQADQAQAQLDGILHYLEANPALAGAVEPLRILLTCYDTLRTLADERAADVLERSYRLLQDQAARLTDESLKQSFLQQVPAHARIIAAWTAAPRPAG